MALEVENEDGLSTERWREGQKRNLPKVLVRPLKIG